MRHVVLTAFAALALVSAARAETNMPAEQWAVPYTASPSAIPPCTAPEVLAKIQTRFADTEASFWSSNLSIVSIDKVRAIGFRPWGLDFIPRQFCTGVATTSDGHRRQVNFSIIEDGGIIGWGWGVQWCVVGLDRSLAYAPACKQALP
ncbi:hypothetical protein NK718_00665 [Alsobacter sp. SYSU M60028]|uniref:Uncharacterized protein n=1 Tax=Alsobacter ponti TaxID=2962936 RepID=A0ABT1L7G4_9HYPH|nr:hypothetical protein [Alsobacter ponti]MCP8937016.1 hypothetical protein [Alsobacter ponti]